MLTGIGLFGASGWYWYQNVLTDQDRILSGMLDKSLQTSSVYRSVNQQSEQNKVEQSVFVGFSPETLSQTLTNLQEASASGASSVKTETIGTKNADFVSYSSIDVSGPGGKAQNFDGVLNKWGKRESTPESRQPVSFLNDALFVVVPFGNLNTDQRKQLKDEIKKVNLYETTKTETRFVNGRPVITYLIDVSPGSLVQVLAKYVELTGTGSSDQLNPALYEGAAKIPIELHVDLLSRHIRQIGFTGSGRTETYGAYNTTHKVTLPTETIAIDELQKRLSAIEGRQQPQQPQEN